MDRGGRKPSSYFCGLKAKNFTIKIIPKVEKENWEIISDQNGILVEVKNFHEELYQCKNNDHGSNMRDIQEGLTDIDFRKLTVEESFDSEGKITIKGAGETLKK